MGTHHRYNSSDSEAMALSLDSIYYNQNHGSTRNHSLNLLQNTSQAYFQPLPEGICSGLVSPDFYQASMEEPLAGEGFSCLKNHWIVNEPAVGYADLQPLSLSMSPGSQTSCITTPQQISQSLETLKRRSSQKQTVHRKSIDTFGQRTSQYRGVTRSAFLLSLAFFFLSG